MSGSLVGARKATLQEVSQAAGVSTATVSRYLNNPETVSPKTGKRVKEAVDRLGYVTNGLARALASRRSMTMGVLVARLTSPMSAGTVDAFRSVLDRYGYGLILSSFSSAEGGALAPVQRFLEREVDGCLFIGGQTDDAAFDLIESKGIPYAATWLPDDRRSVPFFSYDHCQVMSLVADHLVSLGHRRFGFICGKRDLNPRFAQRLQALRDGISKAGGVLEERHVHEVGAVTWKEARKATAAILDQPGPRPTALVAVNDILGVGALLECKARGLDVPSDISVTGSGDTDMAQMFLPALTTVRTPKGELGTMAAEYLLAHTKGSSGPAAGRIVDVELVVRDSTGAA